MSLVSVAMRRASDGGLDKIVATAAALTAGAAVFLMPGGILEQAVRVSGLPDMLPQLSPPLGLKSRAGLALLSAGSAFGSALLMLRILTFLTRQRPAAPAVAEDNAPRIRRRDRHPDAPARAPLSISRDLGEPTAAPWPEADPARSEVQAPRVQRPATRRRAPLIEVLGDIHEEAAPATEEPRLIKTGREAEDWLSEPAVPAVAEEPVPQEPVVEEVAVAPVPEPEPELAPVVVEPQPQQPAWLAAQNDTAEAPAQESLAELLARFERALERKTAEQRAPVPASRDEEVVSEEGMDLRLRSALENLRRFAPSRG